LGRIAERMMSETGPMEWADALSALAAEGFLVKELTASDPKVIFVGGGVDDSREIRVVHAGIFIVSPSGRTWLVTAKPPLSDPRYKRKPHESDRHFETLAEAVASATKIVNGQIDRWRQKAREQSDEISSQ
jgi:hypothetical protein